MISKIGTGLIGLNPDKVSESMISAASECLHHYKMDVSFVIYPSRKSNDPNEQSYQVIVFFIDLTVRNFFLKIGISQLFGWSLQTKYTSKS